MSEDKRPTDVLAEGVITFASTFVSIFWWFISIILGIVAFIMLKGDLLISAVFMACSALMINPIILKHRAKEALEEGRKPPSVFLPILLAFCFVIASVFVIE